MVLTDDKIKVTHQMMAENNMIRGDQYGVPVEPKNPSKGLHWKDLTEIEDGDFDLIEEYFLIKTAAQTETEH